MMYSIINDLSPVYLKQFIQCRHISQYHLRSDFSNNLSLPFPYILLQNYSRSHCCIVVQNYEMLCL